MIALLEGFVAEKSADRVVIDVSGAGYEVLVPSGTAAKLPGLGKRIKVYTRMHVRDDSILLYGFASSDERSLFDLLVRVNGVGPKFALSMLSVLSPDELRRAVATGDVDALTTVPGIGKKVAGRVLLDLKDRLGVPDGVHGGPIADVRDALLALGLSAEEAREAMAGISNGSGGSDGSVEGMLREALQAVGR